MELQVAEGHKRHEERDPRIDGLVFRQPGCFPSFDFDSSATIGDHEVELRRSICRSLHPSADANARLLHRQTIKTLLHLVLRAVRSLADDEQSLAVTYAGLPSDMQQTVRSSYTARVKPTTGRTRSLSPSHLRLRVPTSEHPVMSAQEPHHGYILEQLSQSNNPTSQIEQLRKIKNALIGHELRKQEYIRAGVLPVIADLLCNGRILPEHQERLYIECANIVCVLAHEGPAFVSPILHSKAPSILLSRLSDLPSLRESLALVRCLNAIADGLPPKEPGQWLQDTHFADLLYMSSNTAWIISSVRDASSPLASQQVCDKTIALLCKTCATAYHKRFLVDSGFLSVLAERLASFVVSGGLVSPSLELLDFPSTVASLPTPAPTSAHLSPTLEAIILLTEGSKERARAFINDPAIICVLPKPRSDFSPTTMRQSTWAGNAMPSAISRIGSFAALDGLLPHLPPKEKSSSPSNLNFPPLGSGGFIPRRRTSFQPTMAPIPNTALSFRNL